MQINFPNRAAWTAIVPAAGRGTRLGSDKPKVLYPILGEPLAHWIVQALSPFCAKFVFVVSAEAEKQVQAALEKIAPDRWQTVVQKNPTGMADAVALGLAPVSTPNVVVIWGDQVTLSADTLSRCFRSHMERSNAKLTFPTLRRDNAYVRFLRDENGRLTGVEETREMGGRSAPGENDCGIFFFNTEALDKILKESKTDQRNVGRTTGERNLLPLLPLFDRDPGEAITVPIQDETESIGINTPEEAVLVTNILSKRRTHA